MVQIYAGIVVQSDICHQGVVAGITQKDSLMVVRGGVVCYGVTI